MAGALGFATKENAQYVFGASNGVSDTSVFLGMLFVLALRVLMPIHVICSVMQAANLSKVYNLTALFICLINYLFIYIFIYLLDKGTL